MGMPELLEELALLIGRLPQRAFFRPPATEADIAAVEKATGQGLPEAYKCFLLRHDGGFISESPVCPEDAAAFAAERWNANHLRGCDELIREYADAVLLARDVEPGLTNWPYMPFCHTNGQEVLVFGPPGPDGQQPVLDAFHELGAGEWGVLSNGFADFLMSYIESGGFPPTIALSKG